MKRSELISRILITMALVGAVGAPLYFWSRTPLVHAHIAEDGGWSPDVIQAEAGKPLHLRFTSDDVVHGFAVGQMDTQNVEAVDIEPGKVTDIELTFDKPGIYTFFCTRWCGVNHWRMRGTIEVSGSGSDPGPVTVPMYVSLGLDIDAPHDAPFIPGDRPSASNGQQLAGNLEISRFADPDFYRANSPYQLFEKLNSTDLGDSEKWDVVSYIWESNTTPKALANGAQLAWLIDLDARSVEVYLPGTEPETLSDATTVGGQGPVKGFVLDLGPVWDPRKVAPKLKI